MADSALTARRIAVVAGVLYDSGGNVLIAQRPPGLHMGGEWEFPGGKLHRDEQRLPGLVRELREELGVDVESARPLIRIEHDYPDRHIELDVWTVGRYRGEPTGMEGQSLRWVAPASLPQQGILEADRPVIAAINLGQRAVFAEAGYRDDRSLEEWLERMSARGIDTLCLDNRVLGRDACMASLAARAQARGMAVAEVTGHSSQRGFRVSEAALCDQPGFAFSLLHDTPGDDARGVPAQAELSAMIAARSMPVFLPAAWAGHNLATAWELGAQGIVISG